MTSTYQLLLCFESTDLEYRELALDYWSGSLVGAKWQWDVTIPELAGLHGVLQKDVPKLVKLTATVVNLARRCLDCDLPEAHSCS